jgi:ubiquitin carboxyl-terminal hydrolase L5
LDGLQAGPISFGEVTEDNWLIKAKEEIQKRIEKYSATEIRFNLLAVIDDKKAKAEKEIATLTG